MKILTTSFKSIFSIVAVCTFLSTSCQKESENLFIEPVSSANETVSVVDGDLPVNPYYVLDSIGRPTQQFWETINSTTLQRTMRTSFPPTRSLPTGYYIAPNQTCVIHVSLQEGSTLPRLQIGTHSRNHHYSYNPATYALVNGSNTITANADGGVIWITYEQATNSTSAPNSSAIITFSGAVERIPVFIKNLTTTSDWQAQLDTFDNTEDVLLIGKYAYMLFGRTSHTGIATQDNNVTLDNVDHVFDIQYDFTGLNDSSPRHRRPIIPHLLVETDVPYGLYYAYPYRTAYAHYDTKAVFSPDNFSNWGIWHELGHMMQLSTIGWNGLGEVTVNIFSLAAERGLGRSPNRLVRGNVWTQVDNYLNSPDPKNYDTEGNVWVKLAMFHQLWLAYGDSFYTTMYRQVREDDATYSNNDARKRNFILKACQISGHDLTEFFEAWGLPDNSLNIYDEIAALNLPAPAINPATLRDTE